MIPKLYYSPGACSLAAHIVLEWIGEPYEAVKVDLHHLDPDYKRINPAGAVPALDHGGETALTQCAAILTYLGLTHPRADLLDERSPEQSAELTRWVAFFTGDMHPAFWPYFMPYRYTTSTEPAALSAVKDAGRAMVRGKLQLLDQQLAGRTWIVGNKRSIVDAYSVPMVNWATSALPEALDQVASVRAHHERMLADPGVQRAMEAEGLPVG